MADVLLARWDLLDQDGVQSVIKQAARNVNNARPDATEYDDLAQEASIMVATTRGLIEACEPLQTGLLYHRLRQDLLNATLTEAKHRSNEIPYERLLEAENN